MSNYKYLLVQANVRYWEDARVNGVEDTEGTLIPFRQGDMWCPTIELETGIIVDWPSGTTASIHYKVCDAGEYFILDDNKNIVLKYKDYYVPDEFLCHGSSGYGDYIIFDVDVEGQILKYRPTPLSKGEWKPLDWVEEDEDEVYE